MKKGRRAQELSRKTGIDAQELDKSSKRRHDAMGIGPNLPLLVNFIKTSWRIAQLQYAQQAVGEIATATLWQRDVEGPSNLNTVALFGLVQLRLRFGRGTVRAVPGSEFQYLSAPKYHNCCDYYCESRPHLRPEIDAITNALLNKDTLRFEGANFHRH